MSSKVEISESLVQDDVKLLEIKFPFRSSFMPTIREYLESVGYVENTIVARFFTPKRLDLAIRTGVDRDSESPQWFDITPNEGVLPAMDEVFYAFTWQFREDYKELAFKVDIKGTLTNMYFDYGEYFHDCVAFYDTTQVIRKSQFEYQFKQPQNKKQALLLIAIL